MRAITTRALARNGAVFTLILGVAACDGGLNLKMPSLDLDLRNNAGGFDTSDAARSAIQARPTPDARGVLSYDSYQVALAKKGDTVSKVAARVGVDAGTLARFNGITADTALRDGEVLALPRRVSATPVQQVPLTPIDVSPLSPAVPSDPVRHKVEAGETAYTIARLYDVPVKSLSEWNGLGSDFAVRQGQFLLIPVKSAAPTAAATKPGQGSATPTPPSAAQAQPASDVKPGEIMTTTGETIAAGTASAKPPATPNLGTTTAKSDAAMVIPVSGSIIRAYAKGRNEGIDIGAAAGSPVKAAAKGTVAAVTKDTNGIAILVIKHAGGLLTVYTNIDSVTVKKGDSVRRGQSIAKVRPDSTPFVHFEVRKGLESVDPMSYLQ